MKDCSGRVYRWDHQVGRHDWFNEDPFNTFRPGRRYFRTASGTSVPHHHRQENAGNRPRASGDQHFNRFSRSDQHYVLKYDMGRGRFNAANTDGYARSSRTDDRDWDNGRNTYWRERYHHQGHPEDFGEYDRLGDRRYAHEHGYSSNFRDSEHWYEDAEHRRKWHLDYGYFKKGGRNEGE